MALCWSHEHKDERTFGNLRRWPLKPSRTSSEQQGRAAAPEGVPGVCES